MPFFSKNPEVENIVPEVDRRSDAEKQNDKVLEQAKRRENIIKWSVKLIFAGGLIALTIWFDNS